MQYKPTSMEAGRETEIMRRGTKGSAVAVHKAQSKLTCNIRIITPLIQREATLYALPGTKLGIIVLASLDYLLMTFNCPIGPL